MKIAIMGAGGVGGFFGARLALAGEEVSFIARGAHLAALQTSGLRVEGELLQAGPIAVNATDDPGRVGVADLVLMTAKAYDLRSAAESIAPLVGPDTAVLPLLNGVDIAERIAAVLGAERVLGGLCQLSAHIGAPGLIRQVGPLNKIIFGEFSGQVTPRVRAIAAALDGAGIETEISETIESEIWRKFLFIASAGGVCAVTAQRLGPVLADPDTRALYTACMREIEAVAQAKGVALPPGVVEQTLAFSESLPQKTQPSMALSAEKGQKLEAEALNGAAWRLGRELGVPTPVNRFIFCALKPRANGCPD